MGWFLSFVGRALFASTFLISAYKGTIELDSDCGPATKSLEPKFNLFVKQVSTYTGVTMPHVHVRTVIVTAWYLKAYGAGLFMFNRPLGVFLLLVYFAIITPVEYDFYNYEMESPQFVQLLTQFSQNLALCGALLFFLGMRSSIPRRSLKTRMAKTKTN